MLIDQVMIKIKNVNNGGLNPYSNGICSLTAYDKAIEEGKTCLNPYSNGICSLTSRLSGRVSGVKCLNPYSNGICSLTVTIQVTKWSAEEVLILILMEYAH